MKKFLPSLFFLTLSVILLIVLAVFACDNTQAVRNPPDIITPGTGTPTQTGTNPGTGTTPSYTGTGLVPPPLEPPTEEPNLFGEAEVILHSPAGTFNDWSGDNGKSNDNGAIKLTWQQNSGVKEISGRFNDFTALSGYDGLTFQIKADSGNDFVILLRSDNSGSKAWRLGEKYIPITNGFMTERFSFSDAVDTGWGGNFSQNGVKAWLSADTSGKKIYIAPVVNAGNRTSGNYWLKNVGFYKGDELTPDEVYIIWKP